MTQCPAYVGCRKRWLRPALLFAVLAGLCFTGCASPVLRTYSGPRRPPEDLAVVLLSSDPRQALTVRKIDGKAYTNHPKTSGQIHTEVHMAGGQHKLVLNFAYRVGQYIYETEPFEINGTFQANRIYQLRSWSDASKQAWVDVLELGTPVTWGPKIATIKAVPGHWRRYARNLAKIPGQANGEAQQARVEFCFGCYASMIWDYKVAKKAFTKALEGYRKVDSSQWKQAVCYGNIARCELALGRPKRATEQFKRALELEQGPPT